MNYCSKCMNPIAEDMNFCTLCGSAVQVQAPEHHLQPGTVLNGKFLVGTALGEGGFGITYIGRDINLDMRVAIKEYYPNGYVNRSSHVSPEVSGCTSSEKMAFFNTGKENFLREARILAKFSGSAGIVDVRDFFEANNTAYIVMEYLDGKTLHAYLRQNGKLSPEQTVQLMMPVMESLKKVHTQGLIHRDISPDNVMLLEEGVKLLDFGAARNMTAFGNRSLSVVLKPGYAPEEQYRTKGDQGPWTDIYALCATMYKCITGVTPEDSNQRVFRDELKAPSQLGIAIDPVIEHALMKGLQVHQKDRYQSIAQLLDGLRGIEPEVLYEPAEVTTASPEVTIAGAEMPAAVSRDRDVTVQSGVHVSQPKPAPSNWGQAAAPQNVPVAQPPKAKKKKSRLGMLLLPAVLAVVAVIAVISVFSALGNLTICGEKVAKNEDRLFLYGDTITADDMQAILSLGKLEELIFSNCHFESGTFQRIGEIISPLTTLTISGCADVSDFSSISQLKYLQTLQISECGMTNEMLQKIDFSDKDILSYVDLSGNEALSDLSPLKSVETLYDLCVNDTSVRDFSPLADCKIIQYLSANNCGITDISTLPGEVLSNLSLENNQISDISPLANQKVLREVKLNNNQISDISPLTDKQALWTLELNNNRITDLTPLETLPYLNWLQVSDNQITDLTPLSGCEQLTYLYLNRNQLTNLDGLENMLKLKVLQATENQLENINGITNCTILVEFNINVNRVSDISLLAKSAATLERVFFNHNQVTDISALENTPNLKYLSFDYNRVTTLDPLENSRELLAISAEYNQLTTMDGLGNATKLKYIYLPHNRIESMAVIERLAPEAENDFAVIDLSINNISELCLTGDKKYTYLAVYNNPITNLDKVAQADGSYFLFSYVEGTDYTGFKNAFNFYNIIDCPLDKQVQTEKEILQTDAITISRGVAFSTVEEADQQTRDAKMIALTGSTQPQTEE